LSVNLGLTRGHGSCSLTYSTSGLSAICTFRRLARGLRSESLQVGSKGIPHTYDRSSRFVLWATVRAFGRAVVPFGGVILTRVNACPSAWSTRGQAELIALPK
jgi:hypothetical protein